MHRHSLQFFFEELKNIENWVAWFLAELCKGEKGVQKEKWNQRRNEEYAQRMLFPFLEELKKIENWVAWFLCRTVQGRKRCAKREAKLALDRAC
jgi:hypothetical protein